jgi:hypothetical protein
MVPTSTPAIVTFTVFVTRGGFIGPFGSGFIVPLERSDDPIASGGRPLVLNPW